METSSILLAETNPVVLQDLPGLITHALPGVELTVCTSAPQAEQLVSRPNRSYSAFVVASRLLRDNPSLLRHKQTRFPLVPLIVTIGQADLVPAEEKLLLSQVFDVIIEPVDPEEAVSTLRIAFWQQRFLQLLTQRDRVWAQFKCHIERYPEEREIHGMIKRVLARLEETLALVEESVKLIDPGIDGVLLDLATSVEERTKKRALTRLDRLIRKPPYRSHRFS